MARKKDGVIFNFPDRFFPFSHNNPNNSIDDLDYDEIREKYILNKMIPFRIHSKEVIEKQLSIKGYSLIAYRYTCDGYLENHIRATYLPDNFSSNEMLTIFHYFPNKNGVYVSREIPKAFESNNTSPEEYFSTFFNEPTSRRFLTTLSNSVFSEFMEQI
jgi:hypothetical protein